MVFREMLGWRSEKRPAEVGHLKLAHNLLAELTRKYKGKEDPSFKLEDAEKIYADQLVIPVSELSQKQKTDVLHALRTIANDTNNDVVDLGYVYMFPKRTDTQH